MSGYNGFIGTSLTSKLKKYNIIGISDKNKIATKNVTPLIKNITKIKNSDIKSSAKTIIHLAAVSDITFCNNNPNRCFEVNVGGTNKLLEMARIKDADVIFASSSHVYNNPVKLPIKEDDKISPSSIYSSSKIMAETLCKTYSEVYGLNITILRLFSVYGPNSPKHNLVLNIIKQIKTKNEILLGNINTKRDFVYIDDVVDAFYNVTTSQKKGFNIYNISTNKSTSIKEISKKIMKFNKRKIPIIIDKNKIRKNDILEIRGTYSKFKKDYNWKPKIELEEGIRKSFKKI